MRIVKSKKDGKVKRFAWFPVRSYVYNEDVWIWLEYYYQEYNKNRKINGCIHFYD